MTDNPVFTVFPEKELLKSCPPYLFENGIPCASYYALDGENIVPQKFVFICDADKLSQMERAFIYDIWDLKIPKSKEDHNLLIPLIPFEDVLSAVDWNGDTRPLEVLKHSWLITNHAKRIEKVNTNLDGETTHLLIMGLQQALFIKSTEEPLMNDYLLRLAIKLIDCMAMDNKELKEAYLTGFPCEYISKSRELLFS